MVRPARLTGSPSTGVHPFAVRLCSHTYCAFSAMAAGMESKRITSRAGTAKRSPSGSKMYSVPGTSRPSAVTGACRIVIAVACASAPAGIVSVAFPSALTTVPPSVEILTTGATPSSSPQPTSAGSRIRTAHAMRFITAPPIRTRPARRTRIVAVNEPVRGSSVVTRPADLRRPRDGATRLRNGLRQPRAGRIMKGEGEGELRGEGQG